MIGLQRSEKSFLTHLLHSHVKIPLGIGQGFLFQPLTEVLLPARLDVHRMARSLRVLRFPLVVTLSAQLLWSLAELQ